MERAALQQEIGRLNGQRDVLRSQRGRLQRELEQLSFGTLSDAEREAREAELREQLSAAWSMDGAAQQELETRRSQLSQLQREQGRENPAAGARAQSGDAVAEGGGRAGGAVQTGSAADAEAAREEARTQEYRRVEEIQRTEATERHIDAQTAIGREARERQEAIAREVKDGITQELDAARAEREARLAEFQQKREELMAQFNQEREEVRETQDRAREDVNKAMEQAGWEKEAVDRGRQLQEQVFEQQREHQERSEQDRLDALAREYQVQEAERYQDLHQQQERERQQQQQQQDRFN